MRQRDRASIFFDGNECLTELESEAPELDLDPVYFFLFSRFHARMRAWTLR